MKKFKNSKNKCSTNTQAKLFTMKYYRFGRRRKPFFYIYDPKSKKKSDYIIRTDRSKILDSGFFSLRIRFGVHYLRLGKDM
jgi:hypothetical protein